MTYKISVIIPAYNAKKTIERCIDSVINQTFGFENIELLICDDKSTDNTREIIKKYAEKYKNIKPIFLKENSGQTGYVRGLGVENATSPYIMFLDSDDEYEKDICEVLYNSIQSNDVDYVQCNFKIITDEKNIKYNDESNFPTYPFIPEEYPRAYTQSMVWDKIYKTEIAKDKSLKLYKSYKPDDGLFNIEFLIHSNSKILILKDYYGYNYYIYDDSLTKKIPERDIVKYPKGLMKLSDLLIEKQIDHNIYNLIINTLYYYILFNLTITTNLNKNDYNKEIDNAYKTKIYLPIKIVPTMKWTNILNKLVIKKRHNLIRYYCKIIHSLSQSRFLLKIYRTKINKFNKN